VAFLVVFSSLVVPEGLECEYKIAGKIYAGKED
jgi:hypothetical protein